MTAFEFILTAASLSALALLVVYAFRQFEHKLDLEWQEFEKNKRSVECENID